MMGFREQQLAERQGLDLQHASLYAAQKALEDAKTKDLMNQMQYSGMLGDTVESLVNPIPNMHPDTERMLRGIAANQMMRLSAQGRQHVPENYSQVLQAQDPVLQAIMAAGGASKLAFNTPQGGITTPVVPGLPTVQAPYTLPQGAQRFGSQISGPGMGLDLNQPQQPQQPIASGLPPRPPNLGHPAQAAAINAITGHQFSTRQLGPDVFNALLNIATNTAPFSANQQQTSIPPPSLRERNKVYDTPKGPLKWTGTGWIQP